MNFKVDKDCCSSSRPISFPSKTPLTFPAPVAGFASITLDKTNLPTVIQNDLLVPYSPALGIGLLTLPSAVDLIGIMGANANSSLVGKCVSFSVVGGRLETLANNGITAGTGCTIINVNTVMSSIIRTITLCITSVTPGAESYDALIGS